MNPEEQERRFPELAPELRSRRVLDFLKFFGPGAAIASVTIGSGETVWASRSGAIFGTVYGAFELYVRTAHECVRSMSVKWRNLTLDRMRLRTLLYSGVTAIGLVIYAWWTAALDPRGVGWNPSSIMTIPLHITGVLLAGPWCFAMVWTDRKYLPEPFRMGFFLVTLNVVCGLVFTYFGVLAVIEDFKPFFQ